MAPIPTSSRSVTLLLRGGHRWVCDLGPDGETPGLTERFLKQASADGDTVLHLKSPDGQWLAVRGCEIVGVVAHDEGVSSRSPELRADATLAGSPFILLEQFLDTGELAQIVASALALEATFADATVTTAEVDYRHAKVVYEPAEIRSLLIPRIEAIVPGALRALNIPPVTIANIECQLTAHGDGDFFKLHNDNGSAVTAGRSLTYVYYFNREPKRFSGGQFRLYDTVVADGFYKCGAATRDIEPRCNSLLLFPSHCHHEVLPVHCESKDFADRRFTLNGWVARRA